jgi:hypothetical protein
MNLTEERKDDGVVMVLLVCTRRVLDIIMLYIV